MQRVRLRHLSFPVAFLLPILLVFASTNGPSPAPAVKTHAALVTGYTGPSDGIERAFAEQRQRMIDEAAFIADRDEKVRLQIAANAEAAAAVEAQKAAAQAAIETKAAAEAEEAAAARRAAAKRQAASTPRTTATTARYVAPVQSAAPTSGIGEAIAECESGGSYTAQNPTSSASGKYQFLDSTWDGYGGYESAKDAPPAVQEAAFAEHLASSGTTPWNASRHCWG